jgi:hypothetical protein
MLSVTIHRWMVYLTFFKLLEPCAQKEFSFTYAYSKLEDLEEDAVVGGEEWREDEGLTAMSAMSLMRMLSEGPDVSLSATTWMGSVYHMSWRLPL